MKGEKNRFEKGFGASILRGGAWTRDYADFFCAYYHVRDYPANGDFNRGFRCILPETSNIVGRLIRIA